MKHLTVIGGFALNYKPLEFLDDLSNINYIDINQFPATFNLEDMSTAITPSLKKDNNLLIAYSMGGLLAIDLVSRNPDKFSQVILLNSTPYFMEDNNWLGITKKSFQKLKKKLEVSNIPDFYRYFINLVTYPNNLHESQFDYRSKNKQEYDIESLINIFQSNTTKLQLNNLLDILYKTDYRDKLSNIKNKCILINANNDILIKNNALNIKNYWLDNCSHLNIHAAKEIIIQNISLLFQPKHESINTNFSNPHNENRDSVHNSDKINQKLIQYNFNKAANTYLSNNKIQITAAEKIESYLVNNSLQHYLILDLGSGPGTFKNNPNAILYDLSLNMLKTSKHNSRINGSATSLPFSNASFNVVASNLMLQWVTNKNQVFEELFRILKDHGIFIYSTLIEGSLWQLTDAFSHIDDKLHTLNFIAANEYVQLAHKNKFKVIYSHIWSDTLLFNDIYDLFMHFKLTGTNIPKSNCNNGLGGRKNIAHLQDVYPKTTSQYPLTYKHLLMVLKK